MTSESLVYRAAIEETQEYDMECFQSICGFILTNTVLLQVLCVIQRSTSVILVRVSMVAVAMTTSLSTHVLVKRNIQVLIVRTISVM